MRPSKTSSKYDDETISDGTIKFEDSELIVHLKELYIKHKTKWKITEQAYQMLECSTLGFDMSLLEKILLAKYILNKININGKVIVSNDIANFAMSMGGNIIKNEEFASWRHYLKSIGGLGEKIENKVFSRC